MTIEYAIILGYETYVLVTCSTSYKYSFEPTWWNSSGCPFFHSFFMFYISIYFRFDYYCLPTKWILARLKQILLPHHFWSQRISSLIYYGSRISRRCAAFMNMRDGKFSGTLFLPPPKKKSKKKFIIKLNKLRFGVFGIAEHE